MRLSVICFDPPETYFRQWHMLSAGTSPSQVWKHGSVDSFARNIEILTSPSSPLSLHYEVDPCQRPTATIMTTRFATPVVEPAVCELHATVQSTSPAAVATAHCTALSCAHCFAYHTA